MKKVLFFDDEPATNNYLIRNLVENYGWNGENRIVFVSTAEGLLRYVNQDDVSYDLFVLDVMAPMPTVGFESQFDQDEINRMNKGELFGYVMAEKIRRVEKYNKVPIVFLTGRQIPPIPEKEKDFTRYIRKPVLADEISMIMDDLLKKQ